QGSVRSEQRRLGQKEPPPKGLRRFSVLASLLLGHSPTSGDAPSSRLARTEKRRNKRGRIYAAHTPAPPRPSPLGLPWGEGEWSSASRSHPGMSLPNDHRQNTNQRLAVPSP